MLDEAAAYVGEDSMDAALRLLDEALDAAASLATLSERGRRVPEIDDTTIRELFVKRYRLIYQVQKTAIQVLAFLHGARDFATWRQATRERG